MLHTAARSRPHTYHTVQCTHAVLSLFEAQCAELHNHHSTHVHVQFGNLKEFSVDCWSLCRMISTLSNACNVSSTTFAYSGTAVHALELTVPRQAALCLTVAK
eukprot:14110-Heterococcus_DN1.PRE.2